LGGCGADGRSSDIGLVILRFLSRRPCHFRSHAAKRRLYLDDVRQALTPFYSSTGRPSIDPELMIRMLIVGYCMGIRSERRLSDEVHLNLAYRWFCRLGLDGKVPDHSTFSKNRHGRFRENDVLRDSTAMGW
jgi:transposase